jgi:ABC-type nitrate/sulfonate/bicarbonate transport system ATPase subunit
MSRDIRVEKVSMVFYGQGEPVIALEKNMQVSAGQFASIIGPSGCRVSANRYRLWWIIASALEAAATHIVVAALARKLTKAE